MRYQIRFVDKDGFGDFKYFDANSNDEARELAPEVANNYLVERRKYEILYRTGCLSGFGVPRKPYKKVSVIEIAEVDVKCFCHKDGKSWCDSKVLPDNTKNPEEWTKGVRKEWKKKRGGDSFKLSLNYIEFTFSDGEKRKDEWYELAN